MNPCIIHFIFKVTGAIFSVYAGHACGIAASLISPACADPAVSETET